MPATAGVVDLAMGMSALKGRQNTARGERSATPGRRRIEPATAGVIDLAMGMSALKGRQNTARGERSATPGREGGVLSPTGEIAAKSPY